MKSVNDVPQLNRMQSKTGTGANVESFKNAWQVTLQALHQTILPGAKFYLIDVAKWESIEAYKNATMALRLKCGIRLTEGPVSNASSYKIIRTD